MSFRDVVFYLGCAATWLIILPVVVVSGTIALVTYALFSELADMFLGRRVSVDNSTAREIAQRMCMGQ
jgi:hypothetical protein